MSEQEVVALVLSFHGIAVALTQISLRNTSQCPSVSDTRFARRVVEDKAKHFMEPKDSESLLRATSATRGKPLGHFVVDLSDSTRGSR
jgi:hypothetical protein